VMIEEPERVANNYIDLNFKHEKQVTPVADGESERFGTQESQLIEAWFEDEHGVRATTLRQGRPCTFRAKLKVATPLSSPVVAVTFENDRHHPVFVASTTYPKGKLESFQPGDEAVFSVSFDNAFAPGRIFASPWVSRRGLGGGAVMDRRPRMTSAVVTGVRSSGGLVDLPYDVRFERTHESVESIA
jgi:hypothetical protein